MCGIAGIQVRNGCVVDEVLLTKLQDGLHHRGPDSRGSFAEKNVGLISTRLAIMDVAHGDQPLLSPSGVALVANGEIYNSPELRAQLSDYPYKTNSDCEVILALYEKYGADFAEHLRGMFAVALFDPKTGNLLLSRDPFGIKPLYLAMARERCAFASEISPLVDLGFAQRNVDHVAESELLQLKYVIGNKTIVPEITRLEPGETITIHDGQEIGLRSVSTWPRRVPAPEDLPKVGRWNSPKDLLSRFTAVITDSMSAHLRADVPWCLFYSGGIDSTILMEAARRVSPAPFQALTIGYEGLEPEDESREALRLAHGAGVHCDRIEMSQKDFWSLAPRIAASLDDPMADPAILPLYMLASAARTNGYKVAISGEGADEVFGGYSRYRRATLPQFLRPEKSRRGVFSKEVNLERFNGWDLTMNAVEDAQRKSWASRLQVLQAVDILERLPNCLLIKLDRALMALGIEGRTPFLDKEVLRFAAEVPDNLKANARFGKKLLRDWLAQENPQARPYARKKGFGVPLGSWMAPRSAQLSALIAAQPAIARIFDAAEVKAIVENCVHDEQPAWSLLFYALWHSNHILGIDSSGNIADVLTQSAGRAYREAS